MRNGTLYCVREPSSEYRKWPVGMPIETAMEEKKS